MKKAVSLLLALTMVFALAACGGGDAQPSSGPSAAPSQNQPSGGGEPTPPAYLNTPTDDAEIYDLTFGEFYDAYTSAKESTNLSERYAKIALAEAKMLETGVYVPIQSNGGNYAISRLVPKTVSGAKWGSESDRLESVLVTTELIKSEDRTALTAGWKERQGTGTYISWAKEYLAEHGYTLKDSYTLFYTQDPETWDQQGTFKSINSEPGCFTTDLLIYYDVEDQTKPSLAESWETSDDGMTWTFHLRKGVKWVDSQGREVGEVKADDWVASLQHLCDAGGGAEELTRGVILNSGAYIDGEITDFSQVGVKALDDYTLQYTLENPTPAFETMLAYVGCYSPLCRSYYQSQGGKFGAEFDSTASDYNYGKTPNNIAYCGPYLVTNWTQKNSIVYKYNSTYWNPDRVNVHELTMVFNDNTDTMRVYNDTMSGAVDGGGLNASALVQARADGVFDEYHYVSATDSSTFGGWYNINRKMYHNYNDATKAISPKDGDEDEQARTRAAMLNQNFRLALAFAFDRATYNAQSVGEELKLNSLLNTYVPGNFVSLQEDVTVDINGTPTTFPAGTFYGEIMQAQITADGLPAKVWDPTMEDGLGSSAGFDGWLNPEAARDYMAKAVEELAADGLEISKDNPIQIDHVYFQGSETRTNMGEVFRQSVEANTDGLIKVNLVPVASAEEWYYSGYLVEEGYNMNYEVSFTSGWSADYGDPANYLDQILPDGLGYMTINFGLF